MKRGYFLSLFWLLYPCGLECESCEGKDFFSRESIYRTIDVGYCIYLCLNTDYQSILNTRGNGGECVEDQSILVCHKMHSCPGIHFMKIFYRGYRASSLTWVPYVCLFLPSVSALPITVPKGSIINRVISRS